MSYDLGDLILIQGEFRDPETAGSPRIDPATVKFKVKTPSAVTTTYVYGTDDEVVRSSLGVYTMNISADEAETWFYRIESTGTAQAAAEGTFDVKVSSTDGSGGGGGGGGTTTIEVVHFGDAGAPALQTGSHNGAAAGYWKDGNVVHLTGRIFIDGADGTLDYYMWQFPDGFVPAAGAVYLPLALKQSNFIPGAVLVVDSSGFVYPMLSTFDPVSASTSYQVYLDGISYLAAPAA